FSQNYGSYGAGGYWNGALGYGNYSCVWSNCMAETPSGLVQMVFDGVPNNPSGTSDDELRFQAALQFMARQVREYDAFRHDTSWGINVYGMFAAAKAFRLAKGADGLANPVVMLNDNPSD